MAVWTSQQAEAAEEVVLTAEAEAALKELSTSTLAQVGPLLDHMNRRLIEIQCATIACARTRSCARSSTRALSPRGRPHRGQQEAALAMFKDFQEFKGHPDLDRVMETVRWSA